MLLPVLATETRPGRNVGRQREKYQSRPWRNKQKRGNAITASTAGSRTSHISSQTAKLEWARSLVDEMDPPLSLCPPSLAAWSLYLATHPTTSLQSESTSKATSGRNVILHYYRSTRGRRHDAVTMYLTLLGFQKIQGCGNSSYSHMGIFQSP